MPNRGPAAKCPRCGASAFRRVKPNRIVAFADERVCGVCGARYTPPIPVWAGVAFMMCGLALPVLGLVLSSLLFGLDSLLGLGLRSAFLVLAVVVFVGGIRELLRSEKPEPSPTNQEETARGR